MYKRKVKKVGEEIDERGWGSKYVQRTTLK